MDSNTDVADNLHQEFVRVKAKREGDREAIVTGERQLGMLADRQTDRRTYREQEEGRVAIVARLSLKRSKERTDQRKNEIHCFCGMRIHCRKELQIICTCMYTPYVPHAHTRTALCCRTFKEHCLVFLPMKRIAHRMRIIFGLLGIRASELHGSLTQLQVTLFNELLLESKFFTKQPFLPTLVLY